MTRALPLLVLTASAILSAGLPAPLSAEPGNASRWWEPYEGAEAEGPQILGYWRFESEESVGVDRSGRGAEGALAGAIWSPEGRFGAGALESFAGHPVQDKRHAFVVPRAAAPSPASAFTLEMWLRPKPAEDFPASLRPVLADTKYVRDHHAGFQWTLHPESGGGLRRFSVEIGLGQRSEVWHSEPFLLPPGEWRHAALSYDGAGTVVFWLDGAEIGGGSKPAAGAMAAATRDLSIGDRLGSNYHGFPGWIDEVRFSSVAREFRPLGTLTEATRPAFLRFAEDAAIRATLTNLSPAPVAGAEARISLPLGDLSPVALPDLEPGESHELVIPLDTSLRPGSYSATLRLAVPGWGGEGVVHESAGELPFVVVARPLPHRMPVVMWGLGGTESVLRELPRLKELGFTHCLGLGIDYAAIWEGGAAAPAASEEGVRAARDMLDTALAEGVGVIASISPARWLNGSRQGRPYLRVDREGRPYEREDLSGLFPRVQDYFHEVGVSVGRTYGGHPAFAAALLSTEVRDRTQISHHPIEIEAARKALGFDPPEAAQIKSGVEYGQLPDFPEDRVLSEDDPILAYYRWFWSEGDGWNDLHTRLHEGLKESLAAEHGREDLWTFFDPAVRVPSLAGSGGAVDVLSHWTYTYPDPVRIGLCTDELFAMARANGRGQEVMKMTQIIWYRSQTAPPAAAPEAVLSPWWDYDPDAAYITIAPMHLREALWLKLARPVSGIMYHGWGSLVESETPGSYTFTNPNTAPELKRLVAEVVEPLGPTLLQVPDPPAEVAFLESFTSQMFARRGTYGWGRSWAGDLYQVLAHAQLQAEILHESTLLDGGLKGVKVLVMGDCDVLTEPVVAAVRAFQEAGGLVVGDDALCPAIAPDLLVPRYRRQNQAAEDRDKLLALAAELRESLAAQGYDWPLSSDNPDVYTRRRVVGSSDYLFAINDRREAGRYVGGHGRVLEHGLPSETVLRLRRARPAHVYDLVSRREAAAGWEDGVLSVPLELGPCEGRLLLVSERPVEALSLEAPEQARSGGAVDLVVRVADASGETLDAVVPVELRILDPEGVPAEGSGHYGAAGGELRLTLDLAPNELAGLWEIRASEGATGRVARAWMRVAENAEP